MENRKQRVIKSWSQAEFNQALAFALKCEREDYVSVLYLCRRAGLRPDECFQLDTSEAVKALKDGRLTMAKRTVLLDTLLTARIRSDLEGTPLGGALYLPHGKDAAEATREFQSFLCLCDTDRKGGGQDD